MNNVIESSPSSNENNSIGSVDSTFGPKELVAAIFAHWILIVGFIFGGLLLATIYLYLAKPVYQASATVLFESKSSQLTMAYGDAEGGGSGAGQTLAEMEIIRSKLVLNRVVKDLKSDVVALPRYFPVLGSALARHGSPLGRMAAEIPGLRRYSWTPVLIDVTRLEVPPSYEGKYFTLQNLGDGRFNVSLGTKTLVNNAKVGEVVEATLDSQANEYVRLFVSDFRASIGTHVLVSKLTMAAAINRVRGGLMVAESARGSGVIRINASAGDGLSASNLSNAVANAYLRQNVERRSAEAAQTLAFLKSQLPSIRSKVEAAEGELNTYRLRNSSVDLDKETSMVLSESAEVERKRNEILQKKSELLLTLTAAHPAVQALELQQSKLSEQAGRVQKDIARLPETQQELLRLRREVEVNTTIYTTMLNNMQQLEVAEAGTLGNVRIIDEASNPGGASSPKSLIVIVAGLIGGLVLGLIVLILRRLLDHAEHDPAVIEQFTGIPVYATVPFSREQTKIFDTRRKDGKASQLLVLSSPNDTAAESIRSLRTTLHFSVFESQHKSIMFTGPTPGIGKSFITSNLSSVLAQSPMKVILIDADLRRGTIHDYYGLKRGKGVSNYVLGASMAEVLQESGIPQLQIISTGDIPPNPTELLMSPRFNQMVAEAESMADLVLLDTGPILAVSDAGIIGRVAGATLLVMKAGQHTRREIQDTVKRLLQVGVRVRGLVINQVGRGSGYGYYGYGKYGYYYSYAYGKNK